MFTVEEKTEGCLLVGIDVGSTTTKIAALDVENQNIVYSDYSRHYAAQMHSV